MPHSSARSLTLPTVIAICCLCCRAQGMGSNSSQQRFLSSLWSQGFKLADNQTLTEAQFVRVLADLKIGGYYNATAACSTSNRTGEGSSTSTAVDACLTSHALTEAFGLNLTLGLTQRNFSDVAVALLQQQLSGGCLRQAGSLEVNGTAAPADLVDRKWAYIYGTIAVTVVSILSCLGCILVSCQRAPCYQHVILFLVELAIGSLVGEALLHLLPTVVQNGHEHGEGHEEKEGKGQVPANFMKLVSAAIAICVLHAIDTGSAVGGLEAHSHDSLPAEGSLPPPPASSGNHSNQHHQTYSLSMASEAGSGAGEQQQPAGAEKAAGAAAETQAEAEADNAGFAVFGRVSPRVRLWDLVRRPKLCLRSPVRLCLFIMLSDALHNFADGVAIGAAFALGNSDGLRLSLTIGLHELAHELADFAVLLSCGFSVRAAVLINFLCTFTCFCGLYIAIPLSAVSVELQVWILAVTAAMFLYIALVTMTNLVRNSYRPRDTTAFLVGNLGLIVGFLSVIAISMYEIFGG